MLAASRLAWGQVDKQKGQELRFLPYKNKLNCGVIRELAFELLHS